MGIAVLLNLWTCFIGRGFIVVFPALFLSLRFSFSLSSLALFGISLGGFQQFVFRFKGDVHFRCHDIGRGSGGHIRSILKVGQGVFDIRYNIVKGMQGVIFIFKSVLDQDFVNKHVACQ